MRKVQVKANKHINNQKEFEGEAFFHQWGLETWDLGDTVASYSIAIVEDENGQIWKIFMEDCKFLEPLK